MGGKFSGLGTALYDPKRREFLGRDGAKWGKLGVFYFFFYLGLAGFFCAMLAVFMALTPRDHPYYTAEDSRMRTRSNPLSPGLGFRPQPDVEKNLIAVEKNGVSDDSKRYVRSLDQYLQVYYGNLSQQRQSFGSHPTDGPLAGFAINRAGECTSNRQYGYANGRPCVLVKMNKIIDFVPEPLDARAAADELPENCRVGENLVPIACQGEYAADMDNIGQIRYTSESGDNNHCGSLKRDRFPYRGKENRQDVYRAPYIWVQFMNPTPNVLINVVCRVFGSNIDYDKKTGRGLTRFQIFVNDQNKRAPRSIGEL